VPDLVGTGRFLLKTCSPISGPSPSPCRFLAPSIYPLRLSIAQTHGEIVGTLAMFERDSLSGGFHGLAGFSELVVPDQDLVDSDRNARLTGWRSAVDFAADSMEARSLIPSCFRAGSC